MGKEDDKKQGRQDDGFNTLFLSMLWGAFGTGFFIYGKKQSRFMFAICGILLCTLPIFIESTMVVLVAGLILIVLPFKFGDF